MQLKKFCKKIIVLALCFTLSAGYIFAQDFDYEEFLKSIQAVSDTEENQEEEQDDVVEEIPVDVPEVEPVEVVEDIGDEDFGKIEETDTADETDDADVSDDRGAAETETETETETDVGDSGAAGAEADAVDLPEPAGSEEAEEEKEVYQALALIRYKNTDTISFKLKISYIPKPYILGISLAAGYTEYKLLQPFYFGGYLEPHVGIPQKAFPYKYELAGKAINGPLIVGGKLYAPFGICVFPFQQNIEFFVEVAPGITLDMMWNAKMGKESITSKLYPAFYGMLRTGATYKGFTIFIEGNYDAILGFGVSAGIGYSLNFDLGERN